jgi:membrane protein implicated in regulation of membrane protease activity
MSDLPFWFVIVGLFLVGLELLVGVATGFDLVLIGFSLVSGGLVGNFFGDWRIAVFVSGFLSILYVVVGRSFVKKWLMVVTEKTNIDNLIGRSGEVVKERQVKVAGEVWRAEGIAKWKKGDKIKVISVEGVSLKVKRK